MDSASSHLSIV